MAMASSGLSPSKGRVEKVAVVARGLVKCWCSGGFGGLEVLAKEHIYSFGLDWDSDFGRSSS